MPPWNPSGAPSNRNWFIAAPSKPAPRLARPSSTSSKPCNYLGLFSSSQKEGGSRRRQGRRKYFVFALDSARGVVQSGVVENLLVLQGRAISRAELQQLRSLLESHPDWSRYRLSRQLCSLWDWRAPNGQLKDMAARTLLLKLEQRGHIRLPQKRRPSPNRMLHKQLQPVAHVSQPITEPLAQLRPLQIRELS